MKYLIWILAIFPTTIAHSGTIKVVTGHVLDEHGRPLSGVRVAEAWFAEGANSLSPNRPSLTDASGHFSLDLELHGRDIVITAIDAADKLGGVAIVPGSGVIKPVEIRARPLIEIRGRFDCEETSLPPSETFVTVFLHASKLRVAAGRSSDSKFAMKLPPGRYRLQEAGSSHFLGISRDFELTDGQPIDLGTMNRELTPLARLFGKAPPPWHITDARGVRKDIRPSDFLGKWVVVDFWGYWCGACIEGSLPAWMDFVEDHAGAKDQFVILTIHDPQIKDFPTLERKLEPIIRRKWRGRSLPFPILLDSSGSTIEDYGIVHWPTEVLLDPRGKVVDVPQGIGLHVEDYLASKLPPLPAAARIARALDRDLSVNIEDNDSLADLVSFFSKIGRLRIILDEEELRAVGLDKNTQVPLALGAGLSLRSWLNFTLDPFGLTYIPEGDGVRIVRRSRDTAGLARPSARQRGDNSMVAESMEKKVTFNFRAEPLNSVAIALGSMTGESFVVDPAARRLGTIDIKAIVSGSADDEPLHSALERLLKPIGVRSVIRDEAIVLTAGQ